MHAASRIVRHVSLLGVEGCCATGVRPFFETVSRRRNSWFTSFLCMHACADTGTQQAMALAPMHAQDAAVPVPVPPRQAAPPNLNNLCMAAPAARPPGIPPPSQQSLLSQNMAHDLLAGLPHLPWYCASPPLQVPISAPHTLGHDSESLQRDHQARSLPPLLPPFLYVQLVLASRNAVCGSVDSSKHPCSQNRLSCKMMLCCCVKRRGRMPQVAPLHVLSQIQLPRSLRALLCRWLSGPPLDSPSQYFPPAEWRPRLAQARCMRMHRCDVSKLLR